MKAPPSGRTRVRARVARAHGHLCGVLDLLDEGRLGWKVPQQLVVLRAALETATATCWTR